MMTCVCVCVSVLLRAGPDSFPQDPEDRAYYSPIRLENAAKKMAASAEVP